MSWCGENICLGIKREYTILNATNGPLSEVFPSGRIAPPLVVSHPSGELLLGKDNIGVFVDQNGKLLQEGRICWSEAPTVVVIQKPYAVALLPRHVEIRSLRVPYPLIQTAVLRNVRRLVHNNNAIIIALDNSVHGFFPVLLGAQIVQLTASGDFEEALALYIEDFKCSWLVVKALELSNEEQKKFLHENYGKEDPASVAKVKELYNTLKLQDVFAEYERKSYEKLIKFIEVHPSQAVQAVLKSFLGKIYKRQK